MEKQREKAAQRLQRKSQRQSLPSEDALGLMEETGLDETGLDEAGLDETDAPNDESTRVAD